MSATALRIPEILLLGACVLFLTPTALGQAESASGETVSESLSTGDWTGIRAAYEAGRHAAYSVEGGLEARNPGQGWRTHFDGRGFLTQPDAGGWTWGLELERYGFAQAGRKSGWYPDYWFQISSFILLLVTFRKRHLYYNNRILAKGIQL